MREISIPHIFKVAQIISYGYDSEAGSLRLVEDIGWADVCKDNFSECELTVLVKKTEDYKVGDIVSIVLGSTRTEKLDMIESLE